MSCEIRGGAPRAFGSRVSCSSLSISLFVFFFPRGIAGSLLSCISPACVYLGIVVEVSAGCPGTGPLSVSFDCFLFLLLHRARVIPFLPFVLQSSLLIVLLPGSYYVVTVVICMSASCFPRSLYLSYLALVTPSTLPCFHTLFLSFYLFLFLSFHLSIFSIFSLFSSSLPLILSFSASLLPTTSARLLSCLVSLVLLCAFPFSVSLLLSVCQPLRSAAVTLS